MSFENPLDLIRNKVNKTVSESRLPNESYESTVGVYGGKLKRDEEGKLVYNMKGLISKIDQFGDSVLRNYDEHLLRNPFELLKKHPKLFLKCIFPGPKRYRGNKEEIFENIKQLGLEDAYGLHKDGIEIKDEEIFRKGLALQDIYRSDIINSNELKNIDRFQALFDSSKYIREIHTKGVVGEILPSDIIFREANENIAEKPILNIPDIIFDKEKNTSEDHKKTIDLLDFLMSIGFEEMRRSNEDNESTKKAMKQVLDGYGDKEMATALISFIKRGYLTLQGDKNVGPINLNENSITSKNRGIFTKHNEARMGKNDRNYETTIKNLAIEACNEYLTNNEKLDPNLSEKFNLLTQRTKEFFEYVFDESDDPKKRLRRIEIKSGSNLDLIAEKYPQIIEDLKKLCELQNKEEFINGAIFVLKPVLEHLSALNIEKKEFIRLNGLLTYGIDGPIAHIHLDPIEKISINKFIEGLDALVDIIEKQDNITTITASSDLVTKHKLLLDKFGFEIDGLISEEEHNKYFPGKQINTVTRAHMTREDFLKRKYKNI